MVSEITCKNGEIALCDDEDYPLLARHIWYMGSELSNGGYPCLFIYGQRNTRKQIFMHQLVVPGAVHIDHGTIKRTERAKEGQKSAPDQTKNGIRPLYKNAKDYDGKHSDKQRGHSRRHAGFNERWDAMDKEQQCSGMRNKRSVWTVPTKPYSGAHFATFPPKLIEPCILAGSRPNDIILDPFFGSGTTGEVAQRFGRKWIGCELNPENLELQDDRTRQEGFAL